MSRATFLMMGMLLGGSLERLRRVTDPMPVKHDLTTADDQGRSGSMSQATRA